MYIYLIFLFFFCFNFYFFLTYSHFSQFHFVASIHFLFRPYKKNIIVVRVPGCLPICFAFSTLKMEWPLCCCCCWFCFLLIKPFFFFLFDAVVLCSVRLLCFAVLVGFTQSFVVLYPGFDFFASLRFSFIFVFLLNRKCIMFTYIYELTHTQAHILLSMCLEYFCFYFSF